jgi:hypothetical protein
MNYIVINKKITDKYVSYNDTFYVRTLHPWGIVYVPIPECDMDAGWSACVLDEDGDVTFDSVLFDNILQTCGDIKWEG